MKKRHWILIVVGVILAAGIFICGFSPQLRIGLPQRIAEAKDRWQAQGIDSYDMVMGVHYFGPSAGTYRIRYRDGVLTEMVHEEGARFGESETTAPHQFDETDPILTLFTYAAQAAGNDAVQLSLCATPLKVEIDPTYSYVSSFQGGFCTDGLICGYLVGLLGDCGFRAEITEFTPLP